jgi:hypothetical protein
MSTTLASPDDSLMQGFKTASNGRKRERGPLQGEARIFSLPDHVLSLLPAFPVRRGPMTLK